MAENVIHLHQASQHVVVAGDRNIGFRIVGPFRSVRDAADWANANCKDEWIAAPLIAPDDWP